MSCVVEHSVSLFHHHNLIYRLVNVQGISTSRTLLADASNEEPVKSPLLAIGSGKAEDQQQKVVSKPEKVQAVLKRIKQVLFILIRIKI